MKACLCMGSEVAAFIVMLAWGPDVQAQAGGMNIESLRLEFAVREESFKNVNFRMTVTDRTRERAGMIEGGSFIEKNQVADVILDLGQKDDANPRARAEFSETPNPDVVPRLPRDVKRVSYWESTTPRDSRSLEFHHSGKMIGMISKDNGIRWLVNPYQLLSFKNWSMNRFLFRSWIIAKVEGIEELEGQETVHISWETGNDKSKVKNGPTSSYRGSVWVTPTHGFATVQSVMERKPNDDAPWKEISRIECGGFTSVEGHWLPTKVRFVEHSYYSDTMHYQLTKVSDVKFENWRLNQDLTNDDYEIKFPKGTIVRDLTRGDVTYRRGAYGDPDYIRRHVHKARDLAQWNISVMDVIFWVSLNLAVVCLCLWVFRFVRRMRSDLKS